MREVKVKEESSRPMQLPWKLKALGLTGGMVCTFTGGAVLLKDAVGGTQYDKAGDESADAKAKADISKKLENKVYIVTGANSGTLTTLVRNLFIGPTNE